MPGFPIGVVVRVQNVPPEIMDEARHPGHNPFSVEAADKENYRIQCSTHRVESGENRERNGAEKLSLRPGGSNCQPPSRQRELVAAG